MISLFHIFSLKPNLKKQSGATSLFSPPSLTLSIILTRSVSNIVLNPVTYNPVTYNHGNEYI